MDRDSHNNFFKTPINLLIRSFFFYWLSPELKQRPKNILSIFIMLCFIFPSIYILSYRLTGWGPIGTDWDQTMHYQFAPTHIIRNFFQFPLWDPYSQGGISLIGNPLTRFFSPHFILYLMLPTSVALRIEGMIYLFASLLCSWFFLRLYFKDFFAPLFGAMVYGLSGAMYFRIAGNHIHLPAFAYFPLLFLFFIRSFEEKKFLLFSILAFSLILFDSITYPLSIGGIGLLIFSIFFCLEKKTIVPLKNFILIIAGSLSICAIKALPVFETLLLFPRKTSSETFINLNALYQIFLRRNQTMSGPGEISGLSGWWGEYACYLGLPLVILGMIGIFKSATKHKAIFFSFCTIFIIYLGNFSSFSPWTLMHNFFPFDSQSYSSRFIFLLLIFFSLFVSLATNNLCKWIKESLPQKTSNLIIFFLMLMVGYDLVQQNTQILKQNRVFKSQPFQTEQKFVQAYGTHTMTMDAMIENIGVVDKYDALMPGGTSSSVVPINAPNYRGEIFTASGNGDVYYSRWTPNELFIETDLTSDDTVIVNQNFYPGWKISEISSIKNHEGLLSFSAKKGKNHYRLKYMPTLFLIGCLISMLSIFFWIYFYLSFDAKNKNPYFKRISVFCLSCIILLWGVGLKQLFNTEYPLWNKDTIFIPSHSPSLHFSTMSAIHKFHKKDFETFQTIINLNNFYDPAVEKMVLNNLETFTNKNYR